MQETRTPSVNNWLEDELYQQYRYDRQGVDPGWNQVFETNGGTQNGDKGHAATAVAVTPAASAPALAPGDELVPLRGPALRIAENMTASLAIPVATSQRVMPVKVIEEKVPVTVGVPVSW